MDYEDSYYEDEIDRMRKRREQKRSGSTERTRRTKTQVSSSRSGSGRVSYRNTGKVKRKKRFPLLPLLAIFVMAAGGFFAWRHFSGSGSGYWTIAVFGLDSRDNNLGKGSLSDVEMLCTIDRKTGEIRLASVFRDTYLKIDPDGTYDKVNEAYFLGGPEQAIHTLQDNLDLHVDNYATFNWKAVVDAINILGGVDIEITESEFAYINSFITETVESTGVGSVHLTSAGANHLDGVQAVAYARLRLMDTDFNRTERQRKVLGLAMEKAKQADFSTLTTLVNTVYPQISTSIEWKDILSLAKNAKKYYIGQTSGFPFSHQEMKIDGKSCVIPTTLESNVTQLHSFLYDETDYSPSDTVIDASNHIAEVTGLGEPGKDTESGKNVGAEGNTGSSSASSQTNVNPTTAASTVEETTAAIPETETSIQEEENESPATDQTVEALESETAAIISESSVTETEDEKHAVTQGQTSGTPENGPGALSEPGTTQQVPSTDDPHHALEAPGAGGSAPETQGGPGV